MPRALAPAALAVTCVLAAVPAHSGLEPHFRRCHEPPVALRVDHVPCRYARWFWRHVYVPHPPGTMQRARGFICTTLSLHPKTDPHGRRDLWAQCVRGPQVFRFQARTDGHVGPMTPMLTETAGAVYLSVTTPSLGRVASRLAFRRTGRVRWGPQRRSL